MNLLKFSYISFFDDYPFAKNYDVLAEKIAECWFSNYYLIDHEDSWLRCENRYVSCICCWACKKLFVDGNGLLMSSDRAPLQSI